MLRERDKRFATLQWKGEIMLSLRESAIFLQSCGFVAIDKHKLPKVLSLWCMVCKGYVAWIIVLARLST